MASIQQQPLARGSSVERRRRPPLPLYSISCLQLWFSQLAARRLLPLQDTEKSRDSGWRGIRRVMKPGAISSISCFLQQLFTMLLLSHVAIFSFPYVKKTICLLGPHHRGSAKFSRAFRTNRRKARAHLSRTGNNENIKDSDTSGSKNGSLKATVVQQA